MEECSMQTELQLPYSLKQVRIQNLELLEVHHTIMHIFTELLQEV